jgi:UMF1 family MFS transporter
MMNVFGWEVSNTVLFTLVIALSYFTIAMLSPYLSALADHTGKKKGFMKTFVIIGSLSCMSLFFFQEATIWIGLAGSFLASIGFSGSLVFYNAYLPEIAPVEDQDRLSARGFAIGYLGSSLLLILNLVMIQNYEFFGFEDGTMATRTSFLLVGLWWLLFSQITFKKLPKNIFQKKVEKGFVKKSYASLILVAKEFLKTKHLKRFVLAFFFYSAGVQSVILLAGIFGSKVLNLEASQLIPTILIIQFVGMAGAWLFSMISKKIGNLKALIVAVFVWVGVCIGAYFTQTYAHFAVLAGFVGLVLGGIQALSRSTYSKMLPETEDHATFFSFYDIGEKLATMSGMLCIAMVEKFTGDFRNAALVMTFFFVVGFLFLISVPKNAIPDEEPHAQ